MKIALIGCGTTGKEILKVAQMQHFEVSRIYTRTDPPILHENVDADVIIDFSSAEAVLHNVEFSVKMRKPIVIGTTGWLNNLPKVKYILKDKEIGCIYGANFSIGANIYFNIIKNAAKLIDSAHGYDVGIFEMHHKNKIDSPSGTAMKIGECLINELKTKDKIVSGNIGRAIRANEIQISSSRIGKVYGKHDVIFDGESDTFEITHTAKDRLGFAKGAISAAKWIIGKTGVYEYSDVFNSILENQ